MVCCGFASNLITCAIIDYYHSISVIQFTVSYSNNGVTSIFAPTQNPSKMKIQVCTHIAKSRIETLEVSFNMLIIVI